MFSTKSIGLARIIISRAMVLLQLISKWMAKKQTEETGEE